MEPKEEKDAKAPSISGLKRDEPAVADESKDVKAHSSDSHSPCELDSGEDWIHSHNWDQSADSACETDPGEDWIHSHDWDQTDSAFETEYEMEFSVCSDEPDNGKEVDMGECVLDVFYKIFQKMAQDLLEESLIVLARQLLNLIKKHPLCDTDMGILEKRASDLLRNEKVFNALVKHAESDSLSLDLGRCFRNAKNQNKGKTKGECIASLGDIPLFEKLDLNDQDKKADEQEVLCLALSFVFGCWLFYDEWGWDNVALPFVLGPYSSIARKVEKKIQKKLAEKRDKKKAVQTPKRNTTPHTTKSHAGYGSREGRKKRVAPSDKKLGNTTPHTDGAREVAKRIVGFFLEEQGEVGFLERLTQKITQEVNMLKQWAQTEHTPQVASVAEDFERPKKRARPATRKIKK